MKECFELKDNVLYLKGTNLSVYDFIFDLLGKGYGIHDISQGSGEEFSEEHLRLALDELLSHTEGVYYMRKQENRIIPGTVCQWCEIYSASQIVNEYLGSEYQQTLFVCDECYNTEFKS